MPSKTLVASIEQTSPSKVPILTTGDISPPVIHQFEHACKNYFIHKKIMADDQVSLIIGGILDNCVTDWIIAERDHLIALPFDMFMTDFHQNYLAEDWEEDTLHELLSMSQGSSSFWDYAVAMQSKNSLLHSTTSHLPDNKLHHQIGVGMEVRLLKKVSAEKLNKIVEFRKWLNEVKQCDNALRAEREEYERIAKENCDTSRQNNYSTEPSFCHAPSNNNNISQTVPFMSATNTSTTRKQCPKLLDTERKLLNENEGYLKCRRFFIEHRAVNCPNDFPSPNTYKSLTQSDVNHAKCGCGKGVAAVTFANTVSPSVTASPTSAEQPASHPVAAVLGMSHNPTTYAAPNTSSVIGGMDVNDSDSSGSASVSKGLLPVTAAMIRPPMEALAMHVPHFYWHCLAYGANEFPLTFRALIDHGSSAALISEEYVVKLGLCRKRLLAPYAIELTMEKNGQKVDIEFSEYVKIQLHNPSAFWTSKSVRAIIAPSLCTPMILGLPFLVHNNIVVDASARTIIDKTYGFDLLNPVAPPFKSPPKQKLRDFFKELQEDRKLMVAKLKMVCNDHLHHTQYKFEQVKPVDVLAVIRQCIEILAAQKELDHLRTEMKEEFRDVFSKIPHVDELPNNVFCWIKLKDASKTVQM